MSVSVNTAGVSTNTKGVSTNSAGIQTVSTSELTRYNFQSVQISNMVNSISVNKSSIANSSVGVLTSVIATASTNALAIS